MVGRTSCGRRPNNREPATDGCLSVLLELVVVVFVDGLEQALDVTSYPVRRPHLFACTVEHDDVGFGPRGVTADLNIDFTVLLREVFVQERRCRLRPLHVRLVKKTSRPPNERRRAGSAEFRRPTR